MLALLQFNLPTLLTAMLIGLATGWWIIRRPGSSNTK